VSAFLRCHNGVPTARRTGSAAGGSLRAVSAWRLRRSERGPNEVDRLPESWPFVPKISGPRTIGAAWPAGGPVHQLLA
jgi:hypothetical protein